MIEAQGFVVGHLQLNAESTESLLEVINKAASGCITVRGNDFTVARSGDLNFYSEMSHRDRWFSELHLRVTGETYGASSNHLAWIDNALRKSSPPFDGLVDAASWLGLTAPGASIASGISISVKPPVDLLLDKCALVDDQLTVSLLAHQQIDVTQVGLAIRAVPGEGLVSRTQNSPLIVWEDAKDGLRTGTLKLSVRNADNALLMLSVGHTTVRRHWLVDSAKARNHRLLAVQLFDRDLKMIRTAVMESNDSTKFEGGIAALLFILGFSPAVQIETDAPDLVVATPSGRLAIVECTTRIADFGTKLGKLVDRRGALLKSLQANGHPARLSAVLVCRAPRDQIAVGAEDLRHHKVTLLTGEDLTAAFDRVRFQTDPDELLQAAEANIGDQGQ